MHAYHLLILGRISKCSPSPQSISSLFSSPYGLKYYKNVVYQLLRSRVMDHQGRTPAKHRGNTTETSTRSARHFSTLTSRLRQLDTPFSTTISSPPQTP